MFSKPKNGWSVFKLKDTQKYGLSYLDDIPVEWVGNAIEGMKSLHPFVLRGHQEPGRVDVLVSFWHCYIIREPEYYDPETEPEIECSNVTMVEFCRALYDDIKADFEDWVFWNATVLPGDEDYDERYEAQTKERREKLMGLLEILKIFTDATEEELTETEFRTLV